MLNGRTDEILKWLDFRQRTWRFNEIDPAYRRTFEWIFKSPDDRSDVKWSNLASYLAAQDIDTAYFINGKAGSGKSTLMKFASHHPATINALNHWNKDEQHKILVFDFYFWNLGTSLQKSHVGLLRSLLHRVLSRYPRLIPEVLPDILRLWETWKQKDEPTYLELKVALDLLLARSASFLKLCLFVDGIDEYDGDHQDMCLYLRNLASSPNVKLVVSSRPLNAPMQAFQGCPSLRLQDVTRSDMDTYVEGRLMSHTLMKSLMRRHSNVTLASELTDKAEGVFLWVRLVVSLLLRGLEAGDTLQDLYRYLRALPNDLIQLYRKMMDDMPPVYRIQASMIFQIFRQWNHTTKNKYLSVFRMANAIESPSHVFAIPVGAIEPVDYQWLVNQMEARIRSRCGGLLEVRYYNHKPFSADNLNSDNTFYSSNIQNHAVVAYLHRSVAEFLEINELWHEICDRTGDIGFSSSASLACAGLSMMRKSQSTDDLNVWLELDRVVRLCGGKRTFDDATLVQFWDVVDDTMSRLHMNDKTRLVPLVQLHWYDDDRGSKGYPNKILISRKRRPSSSRALRDGLLAMTSRTTSS